MSETFCILPWMHLASNSTGNMRVCCNAKHGINMPRNTEGKPHRFDRPGDIDRYFNSDDMKRLRREILDGQKPEVCERCFKEEAAGVRSARLAYNEHFASIKDALVRSTGSDGTTETKAVYLDLRFGNLCNLKCRMCNPYSSNQLLDEWNIVNPEAPLSEQELTRLDSLDWFEREETWAELERHLDQAELIYLTGGEPTLARGNYRLLDLCVERGYAKHITLKYNTNLTNIPDKLLKRWEHFKGVMLNVSIDGYGRVNRYIRYPSNWEAIDKNLWRLEEMANPNWDITIHTTVMAYNVTHLPDFFDYLLSFEHIKKFPHLNILDHPDWLNVRVLPSPMKDRASALLMAWYRWHQDWKLDPDCPRVHKIPELVSYMNTKDDSHLLPVFREKTNAFDRLRKQNLLEVAPEFKTLSILGL